MDRMEPRSKAQLAEMIQAMSASIPGLVVASTVAIVGAKAPVVRQIGSGTLIAVADRRFVLTAAHVLHAAFKNDLTLGISGGNDGRFVATTGTWIVSTGSGVSNDADPFDVALYPLNDSQISRLSNAQFVRVADVSFASDLSSGFFVVTGYPGMWSTVLDAEEETMQSRLLQYSTYAFSGSTAGLVGYENRRHFLLEATPVDLVDENGEKAAFRTRGGFSARMPDDLRGISGCSVWMIGDLNSPLSAWTPAASRLVGIETSVYPERGAIKATRWTAITTLLYHAFADLRPVLEIYAHS